MSNGSVRNRAVGNVGQQVSNLATDVLQRPTPLVALGRSSTQMAGTGQGKVSFGSLVGTRIVLVLEDEPLIRCATAEMLSDAGCAVLQAESAIEAFACLNQHEVDVVVADINLPGKLNGLEVGKLAALARPHLKIVVTSGSDAPDGSQMPPNSIFVAKPYRPHQICAAIEA